LYHIDDYQHEAMATECQETPCFIVHASCLFIDFVCHVLPAVFTGGNFVTVGWLDKDY
jgi:hypothetical protein